ncbi:hypothetical protein BT69DRAFT_1342442 [Atractiella rhizophila]|nr:hypothetical protein BT69DRAFT_1342442 [Atractiella rhizophila]
MEEKNTPSEEDQRELLKMKEELRVAEVIVEKYAPSLLEALRKGVGRKMVDCMHPQHHARIAAEQALEEEEVTGLSRERRFAKPRPPTFSGQLMYLTLTVAGRRYPAMIDCGAQMNGMSKATQEAIQASLRLTSSYSITGVNGLTSAIAGIAENVDINLGSMTIPQHFFVTPSITHGIILGQAFLHDSKAFLNYDTPDDSVIISVRQSYHRLRYKIPAENLKWQYRNLDDVALGKMTTVSIEVKEEEAEN